MNAVAGHPWTRFGVPRIAYLVRRYSWAKRYSNAAGAILLGLPLIAFLASASRLIFVYAIGSLDFLGVGRVIGAASNARAGVFHGEKSS